MMKFTVFQTHKKFDWLVFTLLAILLGCVFYAIDFNGLYGQDSHAYLAYSKALTESFLTGKETSTFFWAKLYPLLAAFLNYFGCTHLFALQLISGVSLVLSITIAFRLCLRLFGTTSVYYFIIVGFTQIYFVRTGFLVMSDALAAALCMLVISAHFAYKEERKTRYLIYLILGAGAAVFVRYAVVPFVILPVLLTCFKWIKTQVRFVRFVLVLMAIVCGVFVVIWNNQFLQESICRLGDLSLNYAFSRTIESRDGIVINSVPNALYVFGNFAHLGYFAIGLLLIPFYRNLTNQSKWILLFCGVYLVLLLGLNTQNYRFLVLTHLPVMVAVFPAFKAFVEWLNKKAIFVLITWVLFNGMFAVFSFSKTLKVHRIEREVVKEVKKHLQHESIYSFYVDQAFPSYGIENEVHNFFMEDYFQFETGALVVFNEQQFCEQWKGHRVMNNWKRLCESKDLDTLEVLTDNWIIYRIR